MNTTENTPLFDPNSQTFEMEFLETTQKRPKTALRLRYESEARVILSQIGGLEGARQRLGLSQRKICQLLLVDPSAWTRWSKPGGNIPPHVVRSLQWYLTLESKEPAWAGWREWILKREPDPELDRWRRDLEKKIEQKTPVFASSFEDSSKLQEKVARLEEENQKLASLLEKQAVVGAGWKLILILNSIALGVVLFKTLF